jgi:hypothetical protein
MSFILQQGTKSSYKLGVHHHVPIDIKCLQVLKQLRQMGHLKKDDIQRYGLVNKLCSQNYFAENRFRFLVEWDPNSLANLDDDKRLTLHYAAYHSSIERFILVLRNRNAFFSKKEWY